MITDDDLLSLKAARVMITDDHILTLKATRDDY